MDLTPEEIINEKRQAWNKEKTKKLGSDPKKYHADTHGTSIGARLLRVHLTIEKDMHGTSIGATCVTNTWGRPCQTQQCSTSLASGAQKGVGFDASSGTDTSSSSEDPLE